MIETLQKWAFLAPYATSIGVLIAMFQLIRSASQSITAFEDSISKEYREIIRKIPYNALIGVELGNTEKDHARNEIYNYMDLCNEQIFLRSSNRVRLKTWQEWQDGMKLNFELPFFKETSEQIYSKLPDSFTELR